MPRLLEALVDLVFAPVCLGCDATIPAADPVRLVCRRCRARLRAPAEPICPRCGAPRLRTGRRAGPICDECAGWPPGLRAARSACMLEPPADTLVHQLKYRGWRSLAGPMAERMATVSFPEDVDREARIVVPVPTTAARRRERGYNQTELLARAYARLTGRRVRLLLERGEARATQTALGAAARRANVAGAFRLARPPEAPVARQHLLLVDDVLTTGATAAECVSALLGAGARAVSVLTFGRAATARRDTVPEPLLPAAPDPLD